MSPSARNLDQGRTTLFGGIAVTVMVGMGGVEFIKVTHKGPLRRSVQIVPSCRKNETHGS